MPHYPKHVQVVLEQHLPFDPQNLIHSYYNTIALLGMDDTPQNFKVIFYAFCDGHVYGFEKGVKSCIENG